MQGKKNKNRQQLFRRRPNYDDDDEMMMVMMTMTTRVFFCHFVFIQGFVYPVVTHWAWDGTGWLANGPGGVSYQVCTKKTNKVYMYYVANNSIRMVQYNNLISTTFI